MTSFRATAAVVVVVFVIIIIVVAAAVVTFVIVVVRRLWLFDLLRFREFFVEFVDHHSSAIVDVLDLVLIDALAVCRSKFVVVVALVIALVVVVVVVWVSFLFLQFRNGVLFVAVAVISVVAVMIGSAASSTIAIFVDSTHQRAVLLLLFVLESPR